MPLIVEKLLDRGGYEYFKSPPVNWIAHKNDEQEKKVDKWLKKFKEKAEKNLEHDEPWLTLVSLYGLFGDQKDNKDQKRTVINELFSEIFSIRNGKSSPHFDTLIGAHVEVYLPEIIRYRNYLKDVIFNNKAYHPYHDRLDAIREKLTSKNASFEGNTNLDALISGKRKGRDMHVFIEAKYLSDISKDISYVPVRNQIARNIDTAIDLMTKDGKDLEGLNDFWFVLLTPGIFRTKKYGGPIHSPIASFIPERSRLYCYKMDDYLNPDLLRKDLPHLDKINGGFLDSEQWEIISERIGWLTFEEIADKVISSKTLDEGSLGSFEEFFKDRSFIPESK